MFSSFDIEFNISETQLSVYKTCRYCLATVKPSDDLIVKHTDL